MRQILAVLRVRVHAFHGPSSLVIFLPLGLLFSILPGQASTRIDEPIIDLKIMLVSGAIVRKEPANSPG